ncbi:MAG: DNA-binding response regulator [Burkholderiaceae bacterium]|jgi:DNA-binding NarL/FixJ family response regulator|nr:DNA-binding response regulator [Burkholderiaceae bacterium]
MTPAPARRETVLLVDDAPDELRMLADALEDAGYTTLVATDGESAIARIARITPDVVLLDARMPGIDGFETCRRLRAIDAMAAVPIIFMTGLHETERIVEGLDAGGNDYLVKPVVPSVLVARIRAHLRAARLSAPSAPAAPPPAALARLSGLTPREIDVIEWVAKGKTNRDIAEILDMSPRTVNKHLEHIYAKLGVETRTAAVAQFGRLRAGSGTR